ncbi:MAG TPA: hypothetical protein VD837_19510 [Terriglobales bacterium]|nr:hypothetical protein [Terriglobales bacterium]
MPSSAPDPESPSTPESNPGAEQHVQEAHSLLTSLRAKIAEHPELEDAITKLEEALRVLGVKTGGML